MKLERLFSEYDSDKYFCLPYVIAEAGVNHEGDLEMARRLIREAAEGGADAIKFQTYRANDLAIQDSPAYWDRDREPVGSQYELFRKYDKFWEREFVQLKEWCDEENIEFLSTPFDVDGARFLDRLMPAFKISSSDITNLPFIEFVCKFRKPILLSTGASHLWEIERAVELVRKEGNPLGLMHCVLNYPTEDENANLGMIIDLKRRFRNCIVGYSDHTLPKEMKCLWIASLLGAAIVEKHFTYDKALLGNDHYHAMDKEDLSRFVTALKTTRTFVGRFEKTPLSCEEIARANARRSVVAARAIPSGARIRRDMLTFKRPASGISPSEVDKVVGMSARETIPEDTPLQWYHLDR